MKSQIAAITQKEHNLCEAANIKANRTTATAAAAEATTMTTRGKQRERGKKKQRKKRNEMSKTYSKLCVELV